MAPPTIGSLHALVALFERVEALVRDLVVMAAQGGDRRGLLERAIRWLLGLREAALQAGVLVETVFLRATERSAEPGAPLPDRSAARDISGPLVLRLDKAARTAQEGTREAFGTVTRENLPEVLRTASTALVDRDGRRLLLGDYARAVTSHAERSASTRGLLAGLEPEALVKFSRHGTTHPRCRPLEGLTFKVSMAPAPPMHPGCRHTLEPVR